MQRPETATVVLPAYGRAAVAPEVVRDLAVAAYAMRARGLALDVVVIADPDHAAASDALRALDVPVEVVSGPPTNVGKAYLAGFDHVVRRGRSDLIVTLDANGRHDAAEIPRLVDQLIAADLDVIIGSRWTRGSGTPGLGFGRWALGKLANAAFRAVTGTRGIADATTSFRVARREAVEEFHFDGVPVNSHSVQMAFVATAAARGLRIGEGPIIYRPGSGEGALRLSDATGVARYLLRLRSTVRITRRGPLSGGLRADQGEDFGAADDIERLATAMHFFDWVLDEFDEHLRGRVLEVGAGTGTITRRLVERDPGLEIVCLEPAGNMFVDLASFAALTPGVTAHQRTLVQHVTELDEPFDAVVYLNVLEHLEDDGGELALAARALRPGGTVLVFGPGLPWLYSDLDHKAGHYRRYTVAALRSLAEDNGLDIVKATYFDMLGVVPYLLVYRLLGSVEIPSTTMWSYDRIVVPTSRVLQRLVRRPPVGKNVLLIARKPWSTSPS